MSRGKGSARLKVALHSMAVGETRQFTGCTRNKLSSAASILTREQIMSEIMDFTVFERGGILFATRNENL